VFLKNHIKRGGPKRKSRVGLSCDTRSEQAVFSVPGLHQFATKAGAFSLIVDFRDQRLRVADDCESSIEIYVTALEPAQEHASVCPACRRTVRVRAAAPVLIKQARQPEANSAIADRFDGDPQSGDNVKFFRANLDVFMQGVYAAEAARHTQRRAACGIRLHGGVNDRKDRLRCVRVAF
jgi:hypothetical protein